MQSVVRKLKQASTNELGSSSFFSTLRRKSNTEERTGEQCLLTLQLGEVRFLNPKARQLCYFVLAHRRVDEGKPGKWHRYQTEVVEQDYQCMLNVTETCPIDSAALGAIEVALEWWDCTVEGEDVFAGVVSFVVHKSLDDRWFPVKHTQTTNLVAARVGLNVSNSPPLLPPSQLLRSMFSDQSTHDTWGAIVPGRWRWEAAVLTSLNDWLEQHQVSSFEKYLSQPMASREESELQRLVWAGIPSVYRVQLYPYLASRSASAFSEASLMLVANNRPKENPDHPTLPESSPLTIDLTETLSRMFGEGHEVQVSQTAVARLAQSLEQTHQAYHWATVGPSAIALLVLEESPANRFVAFLTQWCLVGSSSSLRGALTASRLVRGVLQGRLPVLARHFREQMFDPTPIFYEWISTNFSQALPPSTTLRLFDLLLVHGPLALVTLTVAIMRMCEPDLLRTQSPYGLWLVIQDRARYLYDVSTLIHVCRQEHRAWGLTVPALIAQLTPIPPASPPTIAARQICGCIPNNDFTAILPNILPTLQNAKIGASEVDRILRQCSESIGEHLINETFAAFDTAEDGWVSTEDLLLHLVFLSDAPSNNKIRAGFLVLAQGADSVPFSAIDTFLAAVLALSPLGRIGNPPIRLSHLLQTTDATPPQNGAPEKRYSSDEFLKLVLLCPAIQALLVAQTLLGETVGDAPLNNNNDTPTSLPKTPSNDKEAAADAVEVALEDDAVIVSSPHTPDQRRKSIQNNDASNGGVPTGNDKISPTTNLDAEGGAGSSGGSDGFVEVQNDAKGLVLVVSDNTVKEVEELGDEAPQTESRNVTEGTALQPADETPIDNDDNQEEVGGSEEVWLESLEKYEGRYECSAYDDDQKSDIHFVTVRQDGQGRCVWSNSENFAWTLLPSSDEGTTALVAGVDCPYKDETPVFVWEWDADGVTPKQVIGPWDEPYAFKGRLVD